MKTVTIVLIAQATSIICAAGAVYLCAHGRDGWGWFLVVALVALVSRIKW